MKRLLPLLAASALSLPLPSPASDVRVDMGRLSVPDVPIEFHAVAHRPDWTGRGEQSLSLEEDGSGCHAFAIRLDGTTFDGRASYREEDGAVRAEWSLAPDRDTELACLVVSGTLPQSRFAGGTATLDGAEVALRREDAPAAGLFWGKVRAMSVRDAEGREAFSLAFPEPTQVLLQDNRRWGTPVYELRLILGSGTFAAGERRTLAFTLAGPEPRALKRFVPNRIEAGPDWIPVAVDPDVEPGSALDFTDVVPHDAPAGAHGRVVARGPHFEFEGLPGVAQRFYGVNLCFDANFPDHDAARRAAERFARTRDNTGRLHHHDGGLSGWAPDSTALDPEKADRFDFLAAELISRGIYLTTDLFVSRHVAWRACGIDRDGTIPMDTFKTLVQFHEGAFSNYLAFARSFLGHVNPYTGRRYADEPALAWISLVNEGNLGNHGPGVFRDIAALCGDSIPSDIPDNLWNGDDPRVAPFVRLLREREERFVARVAAFLREEMGCRALLTDMNSWFYPVAYQLPRGRSLDYVDDHFYVDHPRFLEHDWCLPSACNDANPIAGESMGAQGLAVRRLLDRPFTITEWNYAAPGRFRGVGGIATGAAAALQDWAAVWRFAWGHDGLAMSDPSRKPVNYFDMAGDPLSLAAERASLCLFLRRDLPELPATYAYALPPDELAGTNGTGRQTSAPWAWASWYAKIGGVLASEVPAAPGVVDAGSFREALARPSAAVRADLLGPDPDRAPRLAPGGGALEIDPKRGTFLLDTPRTCGGFAEGGRIRAGALEAELGGAPATLWASSLDGKPLGESGRVLVTHLTDVQNTGAVFGGDGRKVLFEWGGVPHLMARGRAEVSLALADRPWKVFALSTGGRRPREVPSAYADGRLAFVADIAAEPASATFLYEVVSDR